MGKKPKVRNQRKVPRQPREGSTDTASDQPSDATDGELVTESLGLGYCSHFTRDTAYLNKMLHKIATAKHAAACEHCREEPSAKRGGKQKKKAGGGKSSAAAKAAVASNVLWVCLDCGRHFCGGEVGGDGMPYGHARRHSKTDHHPWVVQFDVPAMAFCFSCNKDFAVDVPKTAMEDNEVECKINGGIGTSVEFRGCGFVIKGLANLGNTCFFNSVLQNLLAISVLRDKIGGVNYTGAPLTMALKKLFAETSADIASDGTTPSPKALFGIIASKVPTFRGHAQQDSHELLRCLLGSMQAEELDVHKSISSSALQENGHSGSVVTMVDQIFGGQLSSTVSSMECDHVSTVFESFLDLSLPVPSKKSSRKPSPPPKKIIKPPLRDKSRGQRSRDKVSAMRFSASAEQTADLNGVKPSESGDASSSVSNNEVKSAPVVDDISWMDYLNPPCEGAASETLTCEDSAGSVNLKLGIDNHNDPVETADSSVQGFALLPDASSKEQESDSYVGREDHREHITPSCTEAPVNSGIISQPNKDFTPSDVKLDEETITQNPCNGAIQASATADSITQPIVADSEQEYDFDGFGGMFNEPEVTSVKKSEADMDEDIDVMLWQCSGPDVSEEVDNRNAPVTIETCLALFTQTETLSGEHAWHCERCTELLLNASFEERKGSLKDGMNGNTLKSSDVDRCQMEVTRDENSSEYPSTGRLTQNSDNQHNDEDYVERYCVEENLQISADCNDCASCSVDSHDIDSSESDTEAAASSLPDERETIQSDEQDNGKISTRNEAGRKRLKVTTRLSQMKGGRVKQNGKDISKTKGSKEKQQANLAVRAMRDAKKRFLIRKAPPVLTIHLKRFNHNARGDLKKLAGHIGFKETLDISPYMDPRYEQRVSCEYRLIGVVEHQGRLDYGHYVAYVRADKFKGETSSGKSEWFHASDSHIHRVSLSEVLRSEAYLLFYERVQD